MQIRLASTRDMTEMIKLLKEFTIDRPKQTLSEKQHRIRAYKEQDKMLRETAVKYTSQLKYTVFVAEENGKLIGYIAGEIVNRKYKVYNKEGYVINWFVEEARQGQGTGRKLFDKLIESFKKAGCTHIGLDTHVKNEKAIVIYEHMGFTKRLVTFFKALKDLP